MEEYILNCYKKWLQDKKGNIAKQLSRLTITANVLVISLFVTLAAIIITFFLVGFKVINEAWVFVPVLLEVIIDVVSYAYISKHEN